MLGDTALAVHPDDQRYRCLAGKKIRLPITDRAVPLVYDSYVDQNFGSGVLKVTPGHDFNDFEIGERFGLDRISIFNADARIDGSAFSSRGEKGDWIDRYNLKDRFEARKLLAAELKEKGFLEKVEPYRLAIGRCYRCQTVVEPYLTPQWFVNIKPLAEPALRAVREGGIRIIPEGWTNSYFAWMENIKDWCVSRQIWWGHQIPAWYCVACDAENVIRSSEGEYTFTKDAHPVVARQPPKICPQCGGRELVQDSDVLDTWFSSALWPFSTFGWPDTTEDLKSFYPTSTLVTGFDILFFWVARMIMMGLKFMEDVPFRDVYIHALVRDEQGQKMSKSKGNVIDPLDIMSQYGTDAFRFTLAAMAAMGRDIKLAEERIAGYQNFVNKLWNASRFVLINRGEHAHTQADEEHILSRSDLNLADRWIRSRLASTIAEARKAIDAYRFNDYANVLYQFVWHEFCDWYIEMSKLSLNRTGGADPKQSQRLLVELLEQILLLLHPIMPFITEEIWQVLEGAESKKPRGSLMLEPYPAIQPSWIEAETEKAMEFLMNAVRATRNLRTEMNLPPGKEVKVVFHGPVQELSFLREQEPYLRLLARIGSIEYLTVGERPKGAAMAIVGGTEVHLPLGDMINVREEQTRLTKEVDKVEEELSRVQKKLANPDFLGKAKAEVIQKEREKSAQYLEKLRTLNLSLERLGEIEQGRN
jgi:valyl-tRNA synthetase